MSARDASIMEKVKEWYEFQKDPRAAALKKQGGGQKKKTKIKYDLPLKELSDFPLGKDGRRKCIALVSPLNGKLMTEDKLFKVAEAVENGIVAYRQAGGKRFGFYAVKQLANVIDNIKWLEDHKAKLTDELKVAVVDEQIEEFKKARSEGNSVLNFYLVIESDAENSLAAEEDLRSKFNAIADHFEGRSLYLQMLGKEEIGAALFDISQRESSRHYIPDPDWELHEVLPNELDLYDDGKHFFVDGYYHRHYYISRYPREAAKYRWLSNILDIESDFVIAFTFTPKKEGDNFGKNLTRAMKEQGAKAKATTGDLIKSQKNSNAKESTKKVIKGIADRSIWLYDTNVTIQISGQDISTVKKGVESLHTKLATPGCKANEIIDYGYEPYSISLPVLYDSPITRQFVHNWTTDNIARLLVFDSSEYREKKGYCVGQNIELKGGNNEFLGQIVADMQDRLRYNNGHLAIIADTGAGKTALLQALLYRGLPFYDLEFVFDLKGDFYFPFGQRIDFSADSPIVCNPLHIWNVGDLREDQLVDAAHKRITGSFSFFNNFMGKSEIEFREGLLSEDLRDAYKVAGLYRDRSLPTLDTLAEVMKSKIGAEGESTKKTEFRINMLTEFEPILYGIFAKKFNGQTNYTYTDFNVFGLNRVADKLKNPLLDLLIRDVNDLIRAFGTYDPPRSRVTIDETHRLCDEENPATLQFISQDLIKEIRGFGCDVVTATQAFEEYELVPKAEQIVGLSYFKIFLSLSNSDYKKVKEKYNLSDEELSYVEPMEQDTFRESEGSTAAKGRGLFFVGNRRLGYKNVLSEKELEMFYPAQFEKLYGRKSSFEYLRSRANHIEGVNTAAQSI